MDQCWRIYRLFIVQECTKKSKSSQDTTISSSIDSTAYHQQPTRRLYWRSTGKGKIVHLTSVLIGNCAINRLLRLLLWWTSTTVFLKFAVNDGGVAFVSDHTTWIWSTTGHSWKLCRKIFSISFRRKVFTLQYQTPSAPTAFSGLNSFPVQYHLTGWSLSQMT